MKRPIATLFVAALLTSLVACGGGGGSTPTTPIGVSTPVMFISTSTLPIGVQGLPYSATLGESAGTAPFRWSIDPTSNQLPAGLSLDAATGVISGTPATTVNEGILFVVVDSSGTPQTAKQPLTLIINPPLTVQGSVLPDFSQFQTTTQTVATAVGGVPPYTYSLAQGTLPPGLHLESTTGSLSGTPTTVGTYSFTISAADSYVPAEVVSQPVTATVNAMGLQFAYAFDRLNLFLNKPFSGSFVANGGTPPYTFQLSSGVLPPGLSLTNAATGLVSGTPTASGSYTIFVIVTDSASHTAYANGTISVTQPLGRNDTPAAARRIGNNLTQASISPLTDSGGVLVPDTDYYQLVATAGSTVSVETYAKQWNGNDPLDTVIELTDANGLQFSTGCNQPGGTSTDFSSPCLNDDLSANPHVQDSSLTYKVPGTSGTQTFLVHVLDWSGSARPDMTYGLSVSGVLEPIVFNQDRLITGTVGQLYNIYIYANGGTGTLSYSLTGSLPPGLTFANTNITGTPTSPGHFTFSVQATDQNSPPQQASSTYSIDIANPVVVTTTSIPDGTVGTPYSFQLVSTGGFGPIQWFGSGLPAGLSLSTGGLISGTPTTPGPYQFSVNLADNGAYPPSGAGSALISLNID